MNKEQASPYATRSHKHLIYACDVMLVNACIAAVAYCMAWHADWIWGLLLFNAAAIIVLRQWISSVLKIHWLESPLNRLLKRLADILLSLTFLLTVFPVMIVVQAVVTKTSRQGRGKSVFEIVRVQVPERRAFHTVAFTLRCPWGSALVEKAPLAFSILAGRLSLWNISEAVIIRMTIPEKQNTEETQVTQEAQTTQEIQITQDQDTDTNIQQL